MSCTGMYSQDLMHTFYTNLQFVKNVWVTNRRFVWDLWNVCLQILTSLYDNSSICNLYIPYKHPYLQDITLHHTNRRFVSRDVQVMLEDLYDASTGMYRLQIEELS